MKGVERWGMGRGYYPFQPTNGSVGASYAPQSPGEKRFYSFLRMPERLSLQRLLTRSSAIAE